MVNEKNVKRGKAAKDAGGAFERRVRADLELRDWIVAKWPNNLDMETEKIVPAKHKMLFGRPMALGTGFPDFIAFRHIATAPQGKHIILKNKCANCDNESEIKFEMNTLSEVIGVEAKMNGNLSKIEQKKCRWYLDNNKFSKILIAKKIKEGRKVVVVYTDFMEQYG